jgi:hypothetical protein
MDTYLWTHELVFRVYLCFYPLHHIVTITKDFLISDVVVKTDEVYVAVQSVEGCNN